MVALLVRGTVQSLTVQSVSSRFDRARDMVLVT